MRKILSCPSCMFIIIDISQNPNSSKLLFKLLKMQSTKLVPMLKFCLLIVSIKKVSLFFKTGDENIACK